MKKKTFRLLFSLVIVFFVVIYEAMSGNVEMRFLPAAFASIVGFVVCYFLTGLVLKIPAVKPGFLK